LVRELTITIDDELEKEMSKCPKVDWADVLRKAIRECLNRKEIFELYNASVEKAIQQEK
jgi:hypothetical protein